MNQIQAQAIQVAYDKQAILEGLSCQIKPGQVTTIIGGNGSGKSTLLKALTRILSVSKGQVLLDGADLAHLPTKEVAKKVSLLPQVLTAASGISCYDLVSYGRYPHQSAFGRLTAEDHEKILWAMEATQVSGLKDVAVDSLSGGQRQRVWIAMALAQDTNTIFLDEPTTYLDLNHQLEILELLRELNQTQGKTIVMVLHDLNLAARFSDSLIAMKTGHIAFEGAVSEVMTKEILREVFQIDAHIIQDAQGIPLCLSYQLLKE